MIGDQMIIVEPIGAQLLIRGRHENNERYEERITDFKPFFYVPNSKEGEHTSLYGDKLRRVYVEHPSKIKIEREKYQRTYEADVNYVNRFLIERYTEIQKQPVRFCHLDIEVEDREGFPRPELANKPILSIACYDNFKATFFVFAVTNKPNKGYEEIKTRTQYKDFPVIVFTFNSEVDMLFKFKQFINDFDFDVIMAWNGDNFDFPYLFNRLNALSLDPSTLSPTGQFDDRDNKPRGRIWLDLMRAYRKLSTHELESAALDYIGKQEVGQGKLEKTSSGFVGDQWFNDFDSFLKYNIHDVWLMVEIEHRKGIVDYFDTVRRLTFCTWYDVFFNSRVLDCYFLRKAKEYGVVLPTKKKRDDDYIPVEGARVIPPKVGMHPNVAVGDVRSLYPTAILTCNMSPETRMDLSDVNLMRSIPHVRVDNVIFRTDKRGFVPRVVEDVWEFRQSLKTEMKKYPIGSPEYKKYDDMQTVAKFLLNSIYGVMLAPHFRLFTKDVGASVTYFGRRANIWMEQMIKKMKHEVIAGDTDSIFFKLNCEDFDSRITEGQTIITTVNESLDKFCDVEFGSSEYNKMFIEFEKIYQNVFFVKSESGEALKKRYAGLIEWKEGKDLRNELQIDIKGFETKRSDTPIIFRNMQKDILKSVLLGNEKNGIVQFLQEQKQMILDGEYRPEEIAIPKGMSKPPHEYTASMPAHVAGAIYCNKFCGGNIGQEKVRYLYVKKQPAGLPPTHVISFVDTFPTGFEIDYERMAKLLIDDKFETIFRSLDWNIREVDIKRNTLEEWF